MAEITHPTIKGKVLLSELLHWDPNRLLAQMAGSEKSPICGQGKP